MNKITSTYWTIYRWFKWDFKYLPFTIKTGFKNLIYWFSIIWNNRSGDYTYLYHLEQKQLQLMLKTFDGDIETFNQIKLCLNLLDIILEKDNRYDDNYVLPYVNMKNISRFHFYPVYKDFESPFIWDEETRAEFHRDKKALFLYNKIKSYYSQTWWY